jgi:hypothetical protein
MSRAQTRIQLYTLESLIQIVLIRIPRVFHSLIG